MRNFVLFFLLQLAVFSVSAQKKEKISFKDLFRDSTEVPDSAIVFPIRGKIEVRESGFTQYKTVEYWVFDATGRQIYNATYAMITQNGANADKYDEIIANAVDKEYVRYMKMQGMINLHHKKFKGELQSTTVSP